MSLTVLKHKPLLELYRQGKKLIELQLESTQQLLKAIQKDGFVTDNLAYNDTIQDG